MHLPSIPSPPRFVSKAAPIGILLSLLAAATPAQQIVFTNLAEDPDAGLAYQRARSEVFAIVEQIRLGSLETPLPPGTGAPGMSAGLPGVAIFDHDLDGDLDVYVSNGPGAANSLFSSQLSETGQLTFSERAVAAGVDATAQNSSGVCFGDVDNDGDADLLVLGLTGPNSFFENLGGGSFAERPDSVLAGGDASSTACSMGDVDGDGRLDVAVATAFDFATPIDLMGNFFPFFERTQLFRNLGGGDFEDVSASSGVQHLAGLPPAADGRTVTWAIALVDVDLDGDVDLVQADDQGPLPTAANGGFDLGYLHVQINDGYGSFVDQPIIVNAISAGSWMGLGFGDLDCDGHLDLLGSNFGDYGFDVLGLPYALGDQATRWLLGQGGGSFADPGLGATTSSAFGWGNAVVDYDNDGDQDLIYHGGLDLSLVMITDNPGVLLENQGCTADYVYNPAPLRGDYLRRNVHGVAVGDLNADGFPDVVTASNLTIPPFLPLLPSPSSYGSPFDATGFFTSLFIPTPAGLVWSGVDFGFGDVTVEISSADNGNGSVSVTLLGSVGLTDLGAVNRDGIGAVVSFTPHQGDTVMTPIVGGSSHLSQHSLEKTFGLGSAPHGTVDVLWPGGVRNRLSLVKRGERVLVPEIPCSFDGEWADGASYRACVDAALEDLREAGVLSVPEAARLFASAWLAFVAEQI